MRAGAAAVEDASTDLESPGRVLARSEAGRKGWSWSPSRELEIGLNV